jgi:hypothetical protein
MPVLDNALCIANGVTLTNTTETLLTYSVDQQTVKRHMENGEEVGFGVFVTSVTNTSSETYNFIVKNGDTAALTSNTSNVAQTGAMTQSTDARINPTLAGFQNGFFLTIPPNSLIYEYVGMSMIGTGTTNMTVSVYLMNESEFSALQVQPANYTP